MTAVVQSSSVTTVLVVGFISAGLMSLTQSIGIIMGANIGTTITAQLIAFKITHYSLVLVAIGFFTLFCSKNEKARHYGHMIMGLGLIFFGMHLMSDGTKPLRSYQPFMEMMQQMDNPLWAILLAAGFTALVQSSSATTGLVITLAAQGFISLDAGIALIFGANIGTCITAILASIGKPREAVRAAVVHVLFNVAGVAIWFAFIPQLALFVTWLSPANPDLVGTARLAAETPRQIANAHTVFNVANTMLLIWFTAPLAWLVQRIVPERAEVACRSCSAEVSRSDLAANAGPGDGHCSHGTGTIGGCRVAHDAWRVGHRDPRIQTKISTRWKPSTTTWTRCTALWSLIWAGFRRKTFPTVSPNNFMIIWQRRITLRALVT